MAAKKSKKGTRAGRSRRGKGESMTEAKANAVEVRTAQIGDNSEMALPEPDDWNHHKKSIRGWKEKVATATSGLRNAKKVAIKAGVNMDSLDMVVSIERKNDPAKTLQFFQQVDLGLSLSDETHIRITPHDGLAGEVNDQAYKRGYSDGEQSKNNNSRYPEGTPMDREYRRGWAHGNGKLMNMTPAQVDAALADGEKEDA